MKCNGVSTTVAASLLGHTEEVNEQYCTYDITEMQDKRLMVGMVTKDIINTQVIEDGTLFPIGEKVIKMQTFCNSRKPCIIKKNRGNRIRTCDLTAPSRAL